MNLQFNDVLAVLVVVLIIAVWVAEGLKKITLPGEINGALISAFTLIIQYYFRKKPPKKEG